MHLLLTEQDGASTGDLAALLRQLEAPNGVTVTSGYSTLMARIASPEYRRRCGLVSY
jgi:hypothetical protein